MVCDRANSKPRVNPLYYVTFTTATLCASFILFRGFNTTNAVNTISLLAGFLVIFAGVYLLNLSRGDPDGHKLMSGNAPDGIATDLVSSIQTRRSMQARRSGEPRYGDGYRGSMEGRGLIHAYAEEEGVGLGDLADSDDEQPINGHVNGNGRANSKIPLR
jgi:hypothetical protein